MIHDPWPLTIQKTRVASRLLPPALFHSIDAWLLPHTKNQSDCLTIHVLSAYKKPEWLWCRFMTASHSVHKLRPTTESININSLHRAKKQLPDTSTLKKCILKSRSLLPALEHCTVTWLPKWQFHDPTFMFPSHSVHLLRPTASININLHHNGQNISHIDSAKICTCVLFPRASAT